MPLIMLDGVDGAGKSTFAMELCDAWNGPTTVLHRGQFVGNPMDEYENSLLDYRSDEGRLLILDRWFLSEIVYGTIMRGSSKLSKLDVVHIMKVLASRGAVNVIMTASSEVLTARLEARGEDYLPMDKVQSVNQAFIRWAKEHNWMVIRSGANGLPETALTSVLKRAERQDQLIRALTAPESYVGPVKPSHLLVHDEAPGCLAGQPTWIAESNRLVHRTAVRGMNTGQVFLSEMSRSLHACLSYPPILAESSSTAEVLHRMGWELVDVY